MRQKIKMLKPCRRGHFGLRYAKGQCIACASIENRKRREAHADEYLAYGREYARSHTEAASERHARWSRENQPRVMANRAEWYGKNRNKVIAQVTKRRNEDLNAKIAHALGGAVRNRMRKLRASKSERTIALLGCTVPEFVLHIEHQWVPGMSWGNWGRQRDCWQLDHKRPCASFDLTDPEQRRACFHFTNYQPLWMLDNLRKGAKLMEAA